MSWVLSNSTSKTTNTSPNTSSVVLNESSAVFDLPLLNMNNDETLSSSSSSYRHTFLLHATREVVVGFAWGKMIDDDSSSSSGGVAALHNQNIVPGCLPRHENGQSYNHCGFSTNGVVFPPITSNSATTTVRHTIPITYGGDYFYVWLQHNKNEIGNSVSVWYGPAADVTADPGTSSEDKFTSE
eukprot:PhM_4_TR10879/c0_g1_i3/m.16006